MRLGEKLSRLPQLTLESLRTYVPSKVQGPKPTGSLLRGIGAAIIHDHNFDIHCTLNKAAFHRTNKRALRIARRYDDANRGKRHDKPFQNKDVLPSHYEGSIMADALASADPIILPTDPVSLSQSEPVP